jgi:uncharacterized repeat protein (TIGR04076 family)
VAQDYHKVKVTMIEKRGQCYLDKEASFLYENPWRQPKDMCSALYFSLAPWVQSASLNGRSWEEDNPDIFLISCPSKKGTVWKVERLDEKIKWE